jgi:hypothetical protein
MQIRYVGPLRPGVEISGLGIVAEVDVPVEVPQSVAQRLLEQDVWAPVETPRKGEH